MTAVKDILKDFYTVDDAYTMDHEIIKQMQLDHLNRERTLASNAKYFVKADGTSFFDAKGKRHVDMAGAIGACSVGNNNEFIWNAMKTAFEHKNVMLSCISYMNLAAIFAHDLALVTPGQKLTRVHTATGGGEAIEGAIKLVRIATRNQPEKTHILSTINAFHGKTTGAVSVGGKEQWRSFQGKLLQDIDHIPFGDSAALEAALKTGKYKAFFVESIQGEAGIIVPPDGYLKNARDYCTKYGAYLVCDEIQSGCARSGKFWACEWDNIIPDVITFGKGISGGLMPFAGYVCTDELYLLAYGSRETCFHHTATYQNNALCAAAGIASIQYILENDLCNQALEKGNYFMAALKKTQQKYPQIVKEVRGRGLMIGMEFFPMKKGLEEKFGNTFATECERYMVEEFNIHIIHTLNNEAVFRFLPPLNVSMDDINYVIDAFEKAVAYVATL